MMALNLWDMAAGKCKVALVPCLIHGPQNNQLQGNEG